MMEKYRYWEILEELPDGWVIDKTAGSPAPNTVFITNGKSVLNGQKRALLKIQNQGSVYMPPKEITNRISQTITEEEISFTFPAKTVNTLARKKFQEQVLKEVMFDLMVCEIEGWDKKEYIKELKRLLNSIDLSSKSKKVGQQTLFDH